MWHAPAQWKTSPSARSDDTSSEHCSEADSDLPFSTSNGFNGATSRREWEFVLEPDPNSTAYVEPRGGPEGGVWLLAPAARPSEKLSMMSLGT